MRYLAQAEEEARALQKKIQTIENELDQTQEALMQVNAKLEEKDKALQNVSETCITVIEQRQEISDIAGRWRDQNEFYSSKRSDLAIDVEAQTFAFLTSSLCEKWTFRKQKLESPSHRTIDSMNTLSRETNERNTFGEFAVIKAANYSPRITPLANVLTYRSEIFAISTSVAFVRLLIQRNIR